MASPVPQSRSSSSGSDSVPLETLLESNLPMLRRFIKSRLGAGDFKESCEDLVQSACREVLQHHERFFDGGEEGFRKWLFATAVRKLADRRRFYRAKRRDQGREIDLPDGSGSGRRETPGEAKDPSPSQVAITREEMDKITTAMEQLPQDYRDVILMARLMEMPTSEIATCMNRSEGAVRVLLFRAMGRLALIVGGESRRESDTKDDLEED